VRAGLVQRAQDWLWSSAGPPWAEGPVLDPGPVPRPKGWLEWVNTPQTEAEVDSLRACIRRRRPYGDSPWVGQTAQRLGLEATLRPLGRPRKKKAVPPFSAPPQTKQK
jgi:putative transposase